MAALVKDMAAGVSEDSSSSDDEELKRCQEAVWNTHTLKTKDAGDDVKKSKRLVVADHEHDGNELQVTQGFQTHVAKKLGLILDSLISEKQSLVSSCVNTDNHGNQDDDDDEEEEGFRLFTTSVPGHKTEDPPAPKRRPIPSSSDSDGEMEARLKEAAISIKDLLSTALPLSNSTAATEKVKKKKKKKKRLNQEENEHADSASTIDIQNNGEHVSPEEELTQTTVKHKKKKKKKKGSTEREVLSFPS